MPLEKIGTPERRAKFDAFLDATEERIGKEGMSRGRTIREAQHVAQQLFNATEGDASKVTDKMIEDEWSKLESEQE